MRRFPPALVLAWTLASLVTTSVRAAPGDLDPTFGGDGRVTTHFSGASAARGVALQPDGKIVAAGQSYLGGRFRFVVARYDHDGSLDTTFDGDGKVTTDFKHGGIAYAVAVQPNGRIVVAGDANGRIALIRYKTNGARDATFGGDGKVTTGFAVGDAGARALAIQTDGKIVVAGQAGNSLALVRYDADGTLDTSFEGDGKVTTSFAKGPVGASGVAIQPDEKIVAAGSVQTSPYSRVAVVRYNPHGALDGSFSGDGKAVTHFTKGNDEGKAVAIQGDGKIIVAGTAGYCCEYTGSFGLVRYNTDGTLDSSFDGDGKVITNFSSAGDAAFDVDLQPDGKIVASGTASYNGIGSAFALARYRSNGALDTTFGGDGKDKFRFDNGLNFGVSGVLQSNGKIVISGWTSVADISSFALARVVGT